MDDFLKEKIQSTITLLLEKINQAQPVAADDNCLPLESPYLCQELQPIAQEHVVHFKVREEHKALNVKKSMSHRPLIPRPMTLPEEQKKAPTPVISARHHHQRKSISSTFDKRPMGYKRHRSKISVLDLSEVQEIEKQKQEEERKRKAAALALKEAESRANEAAAAAAIVQQQTAASVFPPGFGAPPTYWNNN